MGERHRRGILAHRPTKRRVRIPGPELQRDRGGRIAAIRLDYVDKVVLGVPSREAT